MYTLNYYWTIFKKFRLYLKALRPGCKNTTTRCAARIVIWCISPNHFWTSIKHSVLKQRFCTSSPGHNTRSSMLWNQANSLQFKAYSLCPKSERNYAKVRKTAWRFVILMKLTPIKGLLVNLLCQLALPMLASLVQNTIIQTTDSSSKHMWMLIGNITDKDYCL